MLRDLSQSWILSGMLATCALAGTATVSVQRALAQIDAAPPAQGSPLHPCHLLTSAQSVPDGFGAAYNHFSAAKELLIKVECGSSSNASLTVGNGQKTLYIYRFGYEWVNGAWKQIALRGSDLTANDWYIGSAEANLLRSQQQLAEDNMVVAYTCLWHNKAWRCGCRDSNCATSYWQLQAFKQRAPTSASNPPAHCTTAWNVVSVDAFGWLPDQTPSGGAVQAKSSSAHRFRRAAAPDGTMAVQHTITTNDIVDTLAYDSPVFRPEPGYCAVMLRWKMYIESGKQRNQPGKYISLMGGRGQAGGQYQNHYGRERTGPEGWSFYMTAGASRSDPRGVVGSANRSALGAQCSGGPVLGGDPINGDQRKCFEVAQRFDPAESMPTGRWVQVELTSVMNDKNQANGSAVFTFDGKKVSLSKVMWAMDPERSPELYVRWRMMYGGTPAALPPPNNIKEWYKDFELLVAY